MISPWALPAILAGLYLGTGGVLYLFQRKLVFPRDPAAPDPAVRRAVGFVECKVAGHDGQFLTHWYAPPSNGMPVIVVFHGNGGNIACRAAKMGPFLAAGYGVFLVGYRGYGGNPGKPTEKRLVADAKALVRWLNDEMVPAKRLVLYGESLGTAVAVAVATETDVGAVVLEAPFTSLRDVAQQRYWFLPAKWLVRDPFDSAARIPAVQAPLMILHSQRDAVVSFDLGRRLFEQALPPKQFWETPYGRHVDLLENGGDAAVLDFLAHWFPDTPAAGRCYSMSPSFDSVCR